MPDAMRLLEKLRFNEQLTAPEALTEISKFTGLTDPQILCQIPQLHEFTGKVVLTDIEGIMILGTALEEISVQGKNEAGKIEFAYTILKNQLTGKVDIENE